MTTKFSQGARTQTLPPVCRSTTILPIGWLPPPYLDLLAFLEFQKKNWFGDLLRHHLHVRVPFTLPAGGWWHQKIYSAFNLTISILSPPPPNLIQPRIQIWTPMSDMLDDTADAPPYHPGQPWESAPLTFHGSGPDDYCWAVFATTTD